MASDLFRQFNSGNGLSNQSPQINVKNLFQNPMKLINDFNQFRSMIQGNPEQTVRHLLQTGQMSQSVYTQLGEIATEFQKLLRRV